MCWFFFQIFLRCFIVLWYFSTIFPMERFLFYLFSHLSFHVVHVSTNSEKSTGIPRFYQIQVPRFKKSPQKPTWKFPRLWQHCDLAADRGKPLELWKTVRCSPFKLVLVNFLRSQLFFCMWTSWALKVVEVKALSV